MPQSFRRLFYAHVVALVMTAMVVIPLLLGIAAIPSWVSVAYCSAITATGIVFVFAATHRLRSNVDGTFTQRFEWLSVVVGLALAQFTFALPVLVCVYAPSLRL